MTRPPAGETEALEAAYEAYQYCPGAVEQGAGGLDTLAGWLADGIWRLWWD